MESSLYNNNCLKQWIFCSIGKSSPVTKTASNSTNKIILNAISVTQFEKNKSVQHLQWIQFNPSWCPQKLPIWHLKFDYHSLYFCYPFHGQEPTTWPVNNYLRIMVSWCIIQCKGVLLPIVFCWYVIVHMLLFNFVIFLRY